MDAIRPQLVYHHNTHSTPPGAIAASISPTTKAKEVAPFLRNLRKILDCEEETILRWTPDGKAFEIYDMKQMMEYVLPKYFKHCKYTSFQRQLNYFNFRKWTKSKATVCTFSNPYFVRDQPCLAWRINRKKSTHNKSTAKKKDNSIKQEALEMRLDAPVCHEFGSEMLIKVPISDFEPDCSITPSFPSPTDCYAMESELDVQRIHDKVNDISASVHLMDNDSLDWVDALYPSLDLPAFQDDSFEYVGL